VRRFESVGRRGSVELDDSLASGAFVRDRNDVALHQGYKSERKPSALFEHSILLPFAEMALTIFDPEFRFHDDETASLGEKNPEEHSEHVVT
jgi:hypothetical protein